MRCLCHCSSMFMGEGVVASEGPCFTTFSRCWCCSRGIRSLATWRKEACTDLRKNREALCTRAACKRSVWYQFIFCRVPPCKSNMSRRVACSVSSSPFQWRLATKIHVKRNRSSLGLDQRPGISIARSRAEHGHVYHGWFSWTQYNIVILI